MIRNGFKRNREPGTIFLAGIILVLLNISCLQAQAILGARATALGGATSALSGDAWSVFANPALLDDQHRHVSFFAIRYYGLAELTDVAAVVVYPVSFGVIGGGAHRYGNDLYNESRLRLVYKNSWQLFHYGVAINYSHVAMGGGYGSVGALGIDVGIAAAVTPKLWIGARATNINQPKYGEINDIEENLPRNLSIGFSYYLSDVALFTSDVVKEIGFPISYRGGVEVIIVNHLKARAGITTAPLTFSGGFGYNTSQWGINIVVQQHGEESALGMSPGLDFNISW